MRAVLCKSCTGLDVERITRNVEGEVQVVDDCISTNADIVGCTSLSQNSKVVDLRLQLIYDSIELLWEKVKLNPK